MALTFDTNHFTVSPPSYTKDLTPPYSVTPEQHPNPFGPPGPPPGDSSNMLPGGVMKPLDNSQVPIPRYPSGNNTGSTYNPYSTLDNLNNQNSFPPPSATTPEFKWKPSTTPGTSIDWSKIKTLPQPDTTGSPSLFERKNNWLNPKPNVSPYEQVAPKVNTTTPESTTTTNTGSTLDLDKYLKH